VLVATSLAVEPSPAISENGTRKESQFMTKEKT